jgi:site-specific DNA-methyltransferase (adenine-specific)
LYRIDPWLSDDSELEKVDMIVWDKQKIGRVFRTRRKSEYLMILQKKPIHAKKTWSIHDIPDVWDEKVIKKHPHSKPVELQKNYIEATTSEGDIVVDPRQVATRCSKLVGNQTEHSSAAISPPDNQKGTKQ